MIARPTELLPVQNLDRIEALDIIRGTDEINGFCLA